MTCKYKVKIKDIQYNYKVQMTDIQSKYKFKVFCTGYDDSEIKDKIDAMYEAWPKASGEGETITLNDTANTTMAIDLKGNTYQDSTTGKNLYDDIYSDYTRPLDYIICPITLEQGQTYTLSSTLIGTKVTGIVAGIVPYGEKYTDFVNKLNLTIESGGNTYRKVFTVDETYTSPKLALYVGSNPSTLESTFDNIFNNYHIQLEKGNIASPTYEPYTNGASPNPDYPQDIHVVSGDNSIVVCGKNLFNKIYFTTKYENWPAYAVHGDTFRLIPFYVGVGTKVTFSSNVPVASSSVIYAVNELDRIQGTTQNVNINTTRTIEGGSNGYVYLGFVIIRQYYDDLLNGTYWIQIEKGETATNYEASTTYPINLGTMELCKIGGYQDYIYKDNGKWYKYGAIGKVVLNGSESWSDFSVGDTNFRCQYDVALPNILTPPTNPAQLFSNYFKAINRDNAYAKTEIGIAQYGSALGKVFICAPNTILSEQTLASWKTWLSTHNTIVYYVIATPTNTLIEDTTLISQLEALKEAESYSGQTNISQVNNDKPFIITARALKDLSNL